MQRLDRIQRISGLLRYVLLCLAVALLGAMALLLLVPDQNWLTIGDGQLNALYRNGAISQGLMFTLIAPFAILLALGIYWLQRLFAVYQRGHFFTNDSVRCYVWLVWLKAGGFIYSIVWPLLLSQQPASGAPSSATINIEAGTLLELVVLLVIVHLLREAQQLHDENKGFV